MTIHHSTPGQVIWAKLYVYPITLDNEDRVGPDFS
jgi:hypothetical protein